MRKITKIFLIVLALHLTSIPLKADILIPTVTKVYFEKGNQPYRYPVDFTVTCYGYRWRPGPIMEKKEGTYTPENVFSFSAKCPDYGCEIYENYYLNYRKIDYCNVEGKAEGKDFKIEKYANSPIDFSACKNPGQGKFERACTLKFSLP